MDTSCGYALLQHLATCPRKWCVQALNVFSCFVLFFVITSHCRFEDKTRTDQLRPSFVHKILGNPQGPAIPQRACSSPSALRHFRLAF